MNIAAVQFARSVLSFAHIGSVAFHKSLNAEYFECLPGDDESSASNGGFRPFPWGCYTYREPLFKSHYSTISAVPVRDKVYSKL